MTLTYSDSYNFDFEEDPMTIQHHLEKLKDLLIPLSADLAQLGLSRRQACGVNRFALTLRRWFEGLLVQSLGTADDHGITQSMSMCPAIFNILPFTEPLGDPFLPILQEETLQTEEKLMYLMLVADCIMDHCKSAHPDLEMLEIKEKEEEERESALMLMHSKFEIERRGLSKWWSIRVRRTEAGFMETFAAIIHGEINEDVDTWGFVGYRTADMFQYVAPRWTGMMD